MEADDVTMQIQKYIRARKIPVAQMSLDLGMPEERFVYRKNQEKLTASEFLEICAYLGISPENFKAGDQPGKFQEGRVKY